MSKRVVELVRVSTEGQASEDRAGIPAQRAVNCRTAAQQGLEIVQTIEITDVSGTAVLRSRGMQERREMLRRLQDAKEAMQRVGKHPGGSATLPYGGGTFTDALLGHQFPCHRHQDVVAFAARLCNLQKAHSLRRCRGFGSIFRMKRPSI